jgi:RimJ/RimL family protein N-acetyltransferase
MNETKPPAPGAANRPAQGEANPNRPNPNNPAQPGAVGIGQLRRPGQQPGARPQGQGQGQRQQGQGNRPQGQGGAGQRPQGQGGAGQRLQGQGGAGQRPQGANQNAAQQQPKPAAKRPPGPSIRLETENYVVRSIEHADVNEDYRDWTHDQEIMAGVNSSPTEMTIEDMHKYVDRFDNRNSFHFGIFDKNADNKMIGFYVIYRDRRHNLAQTNVVIGNKDYWGKAAVLETRSAVLDFLFDVVKVGKIWGNPMVRNIRSVFNYKAQGFVAEGVLRRHRIDPDGKRVDQVMFGLLPEDWVAQKKKLAETGKLKEAKK